MTERRAGDPILAAIDLLTPAFEASGLDELEVEAGELVVRLARPTAPWRSPRLPHRQRAAPAAPPIVRPARGASRRRACASWSHR